jgi:hypothetical protein
MDRAGQNSTDQQQSVARKLAAIREAAQHVAPSGDIENTFAEIEYGYIDINLNSLDRC